MSAAVAEIAGVFLLRDDGAALLQLRDDKPGLRHANMWVAPGGHCDPGEGIEACARREFLEETGYACGPLARVASVQRVDGDFVYRVTFFATRYDGVQPVRCLEGQDLTFIGRGDAAGLAMPDYLLDVWDQAARLLGERNVCIP